MPGRIGDPLLADQKDQERLHLRIRLVVAPVLRPRHRAIQRLAIVGQAVAEPLEILPGGGVGQLARRGKGLYRCINFFAKIGDYRLECGGLGIKAFGHLVIGRRRNNHRLGRSELSRPFRQIVGRLRTGKQRGLPFRG